MKTNSRLNPGRIGLILSVIGLIGVTLCSFPPLGGLGRALAFFSIPGLIFGTVGRWRNQPRSGFYAVLLGAIGALYLPTLWMTFFVN